jgi:17beta-estradiol 17-dehydrogenase / very-long-chain 3-oxoacyl-CoA reductase
MHLISPLAAVGLATALVSTYRFASFIRIYLRPATIAKYLGDGTYAVVTGATDGIGKAMALELAGRGFNIVLHGRSSEKLQRVKEQIQISHSGCKVVMLTHDARTVSGLDTSAIKALPISVLVNNVGGAEPKSFVRSSRADIDEIIALNIVFSTHLTWELLPHLVRPALILNVSSYVGVFPPPYLAAYAGAKAFVTAFSSSLCREAQSVEIISLITGSVHSAGNTKPVGFLRPDSRTYARSILRVVGCGRLSVFPYWPHAMQAYAFSLMPRRMLERAMKKALELEISSRVSRQPDISVSRGRSL